MDELLVKAIRLGQGGSFLTVTPVGENVPGTERIITLKASTYLGKSVSLA